MTDNRWDTLREALHKLKGYMGMFPAGHYNIMLVDNALEALASLKADYEAMQHEIRHHSPDMKSCSCGAVSAQRYNALRAELDATKRDLGICDTSLERIEGELAQSIAEHALTLKHLKGIEGERDRAIALLEEWQPKVVRTGGPQTLPGRTAAFLSSTAALGHTTEGAPKCECDSAKQHRMGYCGTTEGAEPAEEPFDYGDPS